MPMQSVPIREQATIRLRHCDDDLQVVGGDHTTLDIVTSDDDDALHEYMTEDEAGVVIEGWSDSLTLRVPRHVTLDVSHQNGTVNIAGVQRVRLHQIEDDVRLRMIEGAIELGELNADLMIERAGLVQGRGVVEGDVRVIGVAQVELVQINGDLSLTDTPDVHIEHVSGDTSAVGVTERFVAEVIEGDVKLRDAGAVSIAHVIGDLSATRVRSAQVEVIDGDCALLGDDGAVRLGAVNGDLVVRIRNGRVQARSVQGDVTIEGARTGLALEDVQGDLMLRLDPQGSAHYQANARGDTSVVLPDRCNLTITAQARRGIHGLNIGRTRKRIDTLNAVLGSGDARLDLVVGGELALRGASAAHLQTTMRTPQVVIGGGRGAITVNDARHISAPPATGPTVRLQPDDARSDEERLAILRMVADQRIGADEAEQLLQAIEEHTAAARYSALSERIAGRAPTDMFANLTATQVIDLKRHGVDRQFIAQLRQLGITNLSVEQLIDLRTHGVTPEYIAGLHAIGMAQLTPPQVIDLHTHGVTPEFVQQVRAQGMHDLDVPRLIDLKLHGVDPQFVQNTDADEDEAEHEDDTA